MRLAFTLVSACLLIGGCGRSESPPSAAGQPDADSIHRATLTLDTHVDVPLDFATPSDDPLDGDLQVNLEKMRTGGLDAAFFIVYVGQTERTPENYIQAQKDAETKFAAIHRMTDELYPDLIGLAYTPDDVERLVGEGKLAAAIGIENGYVIGKDLGLLDRYYAEGARYFGLVHDGNNDLADSARPQARLGDHGSEHGGVSDLGAAVIRRLNELGIMVDVSHSSKQSTLDAVALSEAPVIASHSGIAALGEHPRNMDDETLRAVADSGGVVQVVAYDTYIKVRPPEYAEAMAALRQKFGASGEGPFDASSLPEAERADYERNLDEINTRWPPATVADFVDHIDHAVETIGVDHVGIASDFGGGGGVIGWRDALETPNVTAELVRRGYSAEDIGKIWGGNLLRVWREVERVAASR